MSEEKSEEIIINESSKEDGALTEEQQKLLKEAFDKVKDKVGDEGLVPTILVIGKTGAGKSTTINACFTAGAPAFIGHDGRGTTEDQAFSTEYSGQEIRLIDMPGLGDSDKNDKAFKKLYKSKIKDADAFLLIISPPRPADIATVETVQLLLKAGVNLRKICFGYNRFTALNYTDSNGQIRPIKIEGREGPSTESERAAIDDAIAKFSSDLREKLCEPLDANEKRRIRQWQPRIIAYDAVTGWRLSTLLVEIAQTLPIAKLRPFFGVVKPSATVVRRRKPTRSGESKDVTASEYEDVIDDEFVDVVIDTGLEVAGVPRSLRPLAKRALRKPVKQAMQTATTAWRAFESWWND